MKLKKIAISVATTVLAGSLLTGCDKNNSNTPSGVEQQTEQATEVSQETSPSGVNAEQTTAPAAAFTKDFDTQLSYALGTDFGRGVTQLSTAFKSIFDLQYSEVIQGMRDALAGNPKTPLKDMEKTSELLRKALTEKKPDLVKNEKDFAQKASYAVGYDIAINGGLDALIKSNQSFINFNQDAIFMAMQDAIDGKPKMTDEELKSTIERFEQIIKQHQAELAQENNKKLKVEFGQKPNVKTTESGIMYIITNQGNGRAIQPTDEVTVEYTGKLGDGRVFDTTDKRGATTLQLDQVIPGWTEALQLIKKGGEIEVVIPANLAYGGKNVGPIPAGSDLYFQIKVVDAKPAKPAESVPTTATKPAQK